MSAASSSRMLLQIAMRSLSAHKVKSLIVGIILTFGTVLMILLMTFFSNLKAAMERSVTGSLIGHIQILSDKAKDDLAFFGPNANGAPDLGVMPDYVKTREELEKLPNVEGVVPMGRDFAMAVGGNLLDERLDAMRDALKTGDLDKARKLGARIRQIATLLREENENRLQITQKKDEIRQSLAVIDAALAPSFWATFDKDPVGCTTTSDNATIGCLDFLDQKLAPLQSDANQLFLAYIGTDLDLFAKKFDKFRIVSGTMVPTGQRGMLLSKTFYEQQAKNPIAREFDEINDGIHKDSKRISDGKGRSEKADPKLQEEAKRLGRQTRRLLFELGPDESAAVQADLKKLYGSPDDLAGLLTKLLTVDQDNFDAHFKTFYDVVGPRMQLYSVRIGDTVTIRAFTRSGYPRAANLKVYGTFQFEGLDGSLISSVYNLIDLMSFRDLYGQMTPERRKELDDLRKEVGVKELGTGGDTEAELFGDAKAADVVQMAPSGAIAAPVAAEAKTSHKKVADSATFTQADMDHGVVIHAAVVLKDGDKLAQTRQKIDDLIKKDGLGVKTIDWEQAAGSIGQMVLVFRVILVIFFVVIVVVMLFVINNAMLMATKDRIVEIGTMRAIGAQRNFVLAMILLETVVLWTVSAALGVSGASGLIHAMAQKGIPAGTEPIMIVMFGGPRLFPHMTNGSVVFSLVCIAVVSFIATIYPAWSATRVPPIVAMQRRE